MKPRRALFSSEPDPTPGEFFSATMLAFAVLTAAFFTNEAVRISDSRPILGAAFSVAVGCVFLWTGGRGLRRIRTWTVAAQVCGAASVAIGLLTAITGYHAVGRYKIWTAVDRDADLHLVVGGLLVLGTARIVEAWRKGKEKRAEQARGARRR